MTIEQKYNQKCKTVSDINQHLPTLKKYGEECESITEMGVYTINSTWAFLASKPKTILSIDIKHPSEYGASIDEVYKLAKEENISFTFSKEDTLKANIKPIDLLFIDTWHVYQQLKKELLLHGNKAKKYIIMHDTQTYGLKDSSWGNSDKTNGQGLQKAIDEFLQDNPHWKIHEVFTNNNGLTILKRT